MIKILFVTFEWKDFEMQTSDIEYKLIMQHKNGHCFEHFNVKHYII